MSKTTISGIVPALGAMCFLFSAVGAKATPVSDTLRICQDTNCSTITASEGDETQFFGNPLNIGAPFTSSPLKLTNLNIPVLLTILTEPDGTVSDIFGEAKIPITDSTTPSFAYELFVASDPGPSATSAIFHATPSEVASVCGDPTLTAFLTCLPEGNGGPFSMSGYLSSAAIDAGYTANFTSDGDVPEPGSVGLYLGLGMLGLAAWKRRHVV